jgi:hypothetical protein
MPVRNVLSRSTKRCPAHNVFLNAQFLSPFRSPHPHPGMPSTRARSGHSHPGTPDTDVTVPLPARCVAEQATIIRQQISFTQDGCPPSIIANSILMEEIFRLQNRLIVLRGQLGKEHNHIFRRRVTNIRQKKMSSCPISNQVTYSAIQDVLEEMDRIRLDIHNLKVELSKHLT